MAGAKDWPEDGLLFDTNRFFSELRTKIFGKRRLIPSELPGKDVKCGMHVEMTEAVLGDTKELTYESKVRCVQCKGKGLIPTTTIRCSSCRGNGRHPELSTITVKVPRGTLGGDLVRFEGKGDFGAPPGDLVVKLHAPEAAAALHTDEQGKTFSNVVSCGNTLLVAEAPRVRVPSLAAYNRRQ